MNLDTLYNLHKKMNSQHFLISYMGNFSQDLLKSLLSMVERKLKSVESDVGVKQKIFHFMIECVQNICKKNTEHNGKKKFIFLIGKNEDGYVIYSGGIFENSKGNMIAEQIEYVNTLTKDEIKETFYQEIMRKELSTEKLLLTSLLDVSKRTGKKIEYEKKPASEGQSFLSFKTVVQ